MTLLFLDLALQIQILKVRAANQRYIDSMVRLVTTIRLFSNPLFVHKKVCPKMGIGLVVRCRVKV